MRLDGELTAAYIFEDLLPEFLEKDRTIAKKIGAVLAVDLDGENGGQWSADFGSDNPSITRGLAENAKCTVCMHVDDFDRLVSQKRIRPWLEAFTTKKITVRGHLPTALKLRNIVRAFEKK